MALCVQISAEEYSSASPDPVAKLSPEICKHMNEDHADSIIAMVGHIVGMQVRLALCTFAAKMVTCVTVTCHFVPSLVLCTRFSHRSYPEVPVKCSVLDERE